MKKVLFAGADLGGRKRKKSLPGSSSKKGRKTDNLQSEDPICNFESIINRIAKERDIQEVYLKEIYASISAGQFMGKNIKEINDDLNDIWKRSDLETMISLLLDSKIIMMVGIDHPRYICIEYEPDWTIFVQRNSRSGCFRPDLWNNLDGSVNLTVYNQCLDAICQMIMQNPGITEVSSSLNCILTISFREIFTRKCLLYLEKWNYTACWKI